MYTSVRPSIVVQVQCDIFETFNILMIDTPKVDLGYTDVEQRPKVAAAPLLPRARENYAK